MHVCVKVPNPLLMQGLEDDTISYHPLAEYVAEIYDKVFFEEVCTVWLISGMRILFYGWSQCCPPCGISFRRSTLQQRL